uniref:Uncharacterized protein n=1 Tax=Oryza brachyantha TaxID=4533 RepID=J3N2B9_ORYBR
MFKLQSSCMREDFPSTYVLVNSHGTSHQRAQQIVTPVLVYEQSSLDYYFVFSSPFFWWGKEDLIYEFKDHYNQSPQDFQ